MVIRHAAANLALFVAFVIALPIIDLAIVRAAVLAFGMREIAPRASPDDTPAAN